MIHKPTLAVLIAAIVLALMSSPANGGEETADAKCVYGTPIKEKSDIQERLRSLATGALGPKEEAMPYVRQARQLAKTIGHAQYLEQLVYYLAFNATGVEQTMGGALLVRFLPTQPDEVVEILHPHLSSASVELQEVITAIFQEVVEHADDDRRPDAPPQFSAYQTIMSTVSARDTTLHECYGLIQYIYKKNPREALRIMAALQTVPKDTETNQRLLTAERTVSDTVNHNGGASAADKAAAIDALKQLARHPDWWVRLYAAQVIRQHPALRQPDIVSALEHDEHPLVRCTMNCQDKRPKENEAAKVGE